DVRPPRQVRIGCVPAAICRGSLRLTFCNSLSPRRGRRTRSGQDHPAAGGRCSRSPDGIRIETDRVATRDARTACAIAAAAHQEILRLARTRPVRADAKDVSDAADPFGNGPKVYRARLDRIARRLLLSHADGD